MSVKARFAGVPATHVASVTTNCGERLKYLSPLIGKGDSGLSGVSSNVQMYTAQGLDEKYGSVRTPVANRTRRKP
ncbi:MAG: hypothetical protein LCH79_17875 [Proteobacteria bacterium]|nr:hypothetical protein [Pseudomonadota bacterium]